MLFCTLVNIFIPFVKRLIFISLAISFLSCSKDSNPENTCDPNPDLITSEITDITDQSAILRGTINPPTCDSSITSQGFVYGKGNLPTIQNGIVVKSGVDISAPINDLQQNTTYYVRTFLENLSGVYYGNEVSFTTTVSDVKFSTSSVGDITPISAVVNFQVQRESGDTISESGVVYSDSSNPTINENKVNGENSVTIEGLSPNTIYYCRPYATNAAGTFYGEEFSFTTDDGIVVFEVNFSKIKRDEFDYSFQITDDGGYASLITSKGIYFSATANPNSEKLDTESNNKVSGLTANTIYYAFPYFVVSDEAENLLDPIEIKTAPTEISSEIKRIVWDLEDFNPYGNDGGEWNKRAIDADIFIDTYLKYIEQARLQGYYSFNGSSFLPWAYWTFWQTGVNYSQETLDKIDETNEGTIYYNLGKGDYIGGDPVFVNFKYRFRVEIVDFSGNIYYSPFVEVDVPKSE